METSNRPVGKRAPLMRSKDRRPLRQTIIARTVRSTIERNVVRRHRRLSRLCSRHGPNGVSRQIAVRPTTDEPTTLGVNSVLDPHKSRKSTGINRSAETSDPLNEAAHHRYNEIAPTSHDDPRRLRLRIKPVRGKVPIKIGLPGRQITLGPPPSAATRRPAINGVRRPPVAPFVGRQSTSRPFKMTRPDLTPGGFGRSASQWFVTCRLCPANHVG